MASMMIFVTTSLPTIKRFGSPRLGRLFTPRMTSNIQGTVSEGVAWAADNDGYRGFKPEPFRRMLALLANRPGCRFVTAPDVVADAETTLQLFHDWKGVIKRQGLPVALVAQDGLERLPVPWSELDALFIGGTTAWKLGPAAAALTAEAKRRGLWVHMGRASTPSRLRYAASIGCDSVDGSTFGRFPDKCIPEALAVLDEITRR